MPKFSANGVELYYEVTGQGFPLVSHEFAGCYDSTFHWIDLHPCPDAGA